MLRGWKSYRFSSSNVGFGVCIWLNAKARNEFFSLSVESNDKWREANGLDVGLLISIISELCKESSGFQESFFKWKFSWRLFENSSTNDWDCSLS